MKIPVNIGPGSWLYLFFLLITKYEISTKSDEEPNFTGLHNPSAWMTDTHFSSISIIKLEII
jgi:hypothetical protein